MRNSPLPWLALALCAPARPADPPAAPRETLTDGLGLRLVKVPAGAFVMGTSDTPATLAKVFPRFSREKSEYGTFRTEEITDSPAHGVRITRPFFMGACEVTVGQFRRFVEESGYRAESERDGTGGYGINWETRAWEGRRPRYSWRDPGFPQTDDHPVVNVTWADAVAFCRWLGQKEGATYRLPTEAEWEYACRGGAPTRYSFGDDPADLPKWANTYDAASAKVFPEWAEWAASGNDGHSFTAPVGRFPPNAFGLHDMHGNVWEWCSDWYGEDYYKTSPVDDPQGPPTGKVRSRRGGGWHVWPLYCQAFYRNFNTPRSRYLNLGFRVVRDVGPPR